jgi:molecular chaperone DnaJ
VAPQREWFEKDYYAVLGVPEGAPAKDISRAYKKLAKQHHPDANPGDQAAEEKFKEVSAAYDVLNDAEKRKEYDEVRRLVKAGVAGPGAGRPGPGPGGFEGVHFEFTDADDVSSMFSDLLGGFGFGGNRRGARMAMRGRDVETETTISFDEALTGTTQTIRYTIDPREGARDVTVRIPAGIEDGKRIRASGKGEPGHNGGPAGDLYVTVHVRQHRVFGRDGRNLTLRLPVTFTEAALGATVTVPTLDGEVKVKIPAGTQNGKVLRVRNKGVDAGSGSRGDLLLTVDVQVPTHLEGAQRDAVAHLADVLTDDPRAGLFSGRRASDRDH